MERGVRRIMVDISRWQPSPDPFHLLLSHLPTHEHSSVTRFVRLEDRKRALVSRLLQYYVVNDVLGIPFNEIDIRRTQLGKPYLESGGARMDLPNFNFNTSHHGDFVGIASEPLFLIGLDIVSCDSPKQGTLMEFLESYSSCFTSLEWDVIINAGSSAQTIGKFYRYWSLKEAYTKAIGAGLGFELKRLEFRHADWTGISIWVDGQKLTNWKFWFYELGKGHLAAVARGPPNEAIDDYKCTLGQVDLKEEELSSGLRLPSPAFTFCCIEQLVLTMNSYRKDGHLSPRIQNS